MSIVATKTPADGHGQRGQDWQKNSVQTNVLSQGDRTAKQARFFLRRSAAQYSPRGDHVERLGKFLGKEGDRLERLGRFFGESASTKHASCSTRVRRRRHAYGRPHRERNLAAQAHHWLRKIGRHYS